MLLWSDWDESLHHYRRYHRAQLRALFPDEQWHIAHVNYTNVLVYPTVWLVRKWRHLFPRTRDEQRSEDRIPSPSVNAILRRVFVGMAMWRVPFPFGVSLVLVARRR